MARKQKVKRKSKKPKSRRAATPVVLAPTPVPPTRQSTNDYEIVKERQALISRERSAKGRDIGDIPDIADVERRESCKFDYRLFCNTYNPSGFSLPWSDEQIESADRIRETILQSVLYARAEPRGGGKSTRFRMATLWAQVYCHQFFPALINATDDKGERATDAIKKYIRFLPLFRADFPEISYPARRLKGIAHAAAGQLCHGESTQIIWGSNRVVLPTVPPPKNWPKHWPLRADGMVPTSGSPIMSIGLTADGIRGMSDVLESGETVRPGVVLLDDPQTRKSARSPTETDNRERLIMGDVLGLAGPGESLAVMAALTLIYPGDLADRMTDRARNPLWRGDRVGILWSMPTNLEAWEEYFKLYRACSQLKPPNLAECNAMYVEKREILDAGAVAGWEARKLTTEVSAIQHAMNLYCRDQRAFWAEFMNRPTAEIDLGSEKIRELDESDLAKKLNNLPRGIVPRECNRLTAHFDVQAEVLFWMACAWSDAFGGAVVDYGVFPTQRQAVFEAQRPDTKLSDQPGYTGLERRARVYKALTDLVPAVMGRTWKQDGADGLLTASLGLIDAGFETEAVHDFLGRSPLRPVLKPSMGKGLKADNKPMNLYRQAPGDLMGWNWRIDAQTQAKGRFVSFSTNAWKTFIADAIQAPPGAKGSLYLPGTSLVEHPLLTLHLLSEIGVGTSGPWGRVEVWKKRREHRENHWLDTLVGAAVAAQILGIMPSAAAAAGDTSSPESERRPAADRSSYEASRRAFEQRRGY